MHGFALHFALAGVGAAIYLFAAKSNWTSIWGFIGNGQLQSEQTPPAIGNIAQSYTTHMAD